MFSQYRISKWSEESLLLTLQDTYIWKLFVNPCYFSNCRLSISCFVKISFSFLFRMCVYPRPASKTWKLFFDAMDTDNSGFIEVKWVHFITICEWGWAIISVVSPTTFRLLVCLSVRTTTFELFEAGTLFWAYSYIHLYNIYVKFE